MRVKAILLATAYVLIVLGIASLLTACETARAVVHACRDGLCR